MNAPAQPLWTGTAGAKAILARIRPADLTVAYRFSATTSPDRYVLTGAPVTRLREAVTAHVEQVMGCSLEEAEKRDLLMEWMGVWMAQPEPEVVLAERFGDPNRMGFQRAAGSSLSDGYWTQVWRAQFPQKAVAA